MEVNILSTRIITEINMGRTVTNVDRTCGPTHLLVFSGNKICLTPILRIGDQVLTFDVFWPKHLHEVRSTVYIHVQSI